MNIKKISEIIHANAILKGWWPDERPVPEVLCLIHSEVSEALEAFRDGDQQLFAEELADIAIRVFDAAEGYGIDIEKEILKKHKKNLARPFRHGGKLC